LVVWADCKQPGLRYAFRERCLIEPEVHAIRLIIVAAKFASVIFRPEEDSLVSIIVNDVSAGERLPIHIRLKQERRGTLRDHVPR
jgi:hypothetical protein